MIKMDLIIWYYPEWKDADYPGEYHLRTDKLSAHRLVNLLGDMQENNLRKRTIELTPYKSKVHGICHDEGISSCTYEKLKIYYNPGRTGRKEIVIAGDESGTLEIYFNKDNIKAFKAALKGIVKGGDEYGISVFEELPIVNSFSKPRLQECSISFWEYYPEAV